MQCGDITHAQSLFNTSTKKILSMYGTMMKSNNYFYIYHIFDQTRFSGSIKNNMVNKVIDLFNEIQNPDEVIIILLFNICAQLKSNDTLNLTKKILLKIPKSFNSNPRLSTSLLDALIKCGDCSSSEIAFSKMKNL